GQIRRVPVGGGTPLVLCTIRQNSGGMNWAADDTLVFSQGPLGIWRVSGGGGTPELITRPPTEGQGALHPQILPGNRAVLYTLRTLTDATTDQIVVQSIDGGRPRVVVPHGYAAQYLPTGHLAYVDGGTLFAVPFDLKRLATTGKPVPLVERVMRSVRGA